MHGAGTPPVARILDQQFVAHIFAPAEGPGATAAYQALTEIWDGCCRKFGMTDPVPEYDLPSVMPPASEAIAVHGERALAAQERPGVNCQAIVRLHHDVLCLSVGIARPDTAGDQPRWTAFDDQWDALVTRHTGKLLGEVRIYLAPVDAAAEIRAASPALYTRLSPLLPAGAADPAGPSGGVATADGQVALWETSTEPEDRARRRFLVPFTPDADPVASAWVWSRGDLDIPPLARYLLHAAKLRYEMRVWKRDSQTRRLLSSLDSLASKVRKGDAETQAVLRERQRDAALLHTELRVLRRTAEIAVDNLGRAFDLSGLLAPGTPFADDADLGRELLERLDDEIEYLGLAAVQAEVLSDERSAPPAKPVAAPGAASVFAPGAGPSSAPGSVGDPGRNVFVVYGRDEQARLAVFEFLRALDLRPMQWETLVRGTGDTAPFLREVVRGGIELAQAVVVLMTPEDVVHLHPDLDGEETESRDTLQARPNVLLELGMALVAKPAATVVLMVGRHRPVTDLGGINFIALDEREECRHKIKGRLELAGCAVDDSGSDWLHAGDFAGLAARHRVP